MLLLLHMLLYVIRVVGGAIFSFITNKIESTIKGLAVFGASSSNAAFGLLKVTNIVG